MFGAGFFTEGNIGKKKDNQKKSSANLCPNTNTQYSIHNFSSNSSVFTEASKNTIPKKISHVNIKKLLKIVIEVKFGVSITKAKNPAAKLIKSPEKALSHGFVRNLSTTKKYTMI